MIESSEEFYQWGAWFAVQGRAAWLSHHDTFRHWQRALRRTDVSLRYSSGFNPHPKLSLPTPRSVGQSSLQELTLFETQARYEARDLHQQLAQQMPENITLVRCGCYGPRVKAYPTAITYRLRLSDEINTAILDDKIAGFNAAATWFIHREAHGRHPQRRLDIRPGVSRLRRNRQELRCALIFDAAGTCRIDELLAALDVPLNGVEELLREQVSYRVVQSGQTREVADLAAFMALAQSSA